MSLPAGAGGGCTTGPVGGPAGACAGALGCAAPPSGALAAGGAPDGAQLATRRMAAAMASRLVIPGAVSIPLKGVLGTPGDPTAARKALSSVADAISNATTYLKAHPEEARYTDSAAVAKLVSGLTVTVTDPNGRSITTDMSTGIGGGDTAPSPGWLFRAALAACDTTLIAMRAAMLGVELTEVEVTINSESNDYGILGIDDSVPSGPLGIRTHVRAKAKGVTAPQLRNLVDWAVAHCPVCDAAKRAVPMTLEIEV